MPWELIAVSAVCFAAGFKLRIGGFAIFLTILLAAKLAATLAMGTSLFAVLIFYLAGQVAYFAGLLVHAGLTDRMQSKQSASRPVLTPSPNNPRTDKARSARPGRAGIRSREPVGCLRAVSRFCIDRGG